MTKTEKSRPEERPEGARVFRLSPFTSQSGGPTTRFPIDYEGTEYRPGKGFWKTNEEGAAALCLRVVFTGLERR